MTKFLIAMLILFAALFVLVPIVGVALGFAFSLGGLVIWFLPILIIALSSRTTGGEKLAWILAIVFLSWFAWVFYFLLAPVKSRRYERYPDTYRYR